MSFVWIDRGISHNLINRLFQTCPIKALTYPYFILCSHDSAFVKGLLYLYKQLQSYFCNIAGVFYKLVISSLYLGGDSYLFEAPLLFYNPVIPPKLLHTFFMFFYTCYVCIKNRNHKNCKDCSDSHTSSNHRSQRNSNFFSCPAGKCQRNCPQNHGKCCH